MYKASDRHEHTQCTSLAMSKDVQKPWESHLNWKFHFTESRPKSPEADKLVQGNFLVVAIQLHPKAQCLLEIFLKLWSSLIPHLPATTQKFGNASLKCCFKLTLQDAT